MMRVPLVGGQTDNNSSFSFFCACACVLVVTVATMVAPSSVVGVTYPHHICNSWDLVCTKFLLHLTRPRTSESLTRTITLLTKQFSSSSVFPNRGWWPVTKSYFSFISFTICELTTSTFYLTICTFSELLLLLLLHPHREFLKPAVYTFLNKC